MVVVLLSFSGCLHLDGLADTADGFLSSRSRERILEIMKDSHIGAMGVIGDRLRAAGEIRRRWRRCRPHELWPAVLLMPLAGRCAIVVHMALLPYARPERAGGHLLPPTAALGGRLGRGPFWRPSAFGLLGSRGLVVWAVCMAVTLALSVYVYRKIGGATGDTFGAVCEIIEVVPALTLAVGPLATW